MKRYIVIIVLAVFVAASFCAMPVYAQDNVIDKVGDWVATRGKNEPEKSMILAQRKSERAAKRAEKEMGKQSKQMEKGMKNAFGR